MASSKWAARRCSVTPRTLWQRIRAEIPERPGAEATIRRYVRERRQELGWSQPDDLRAGVIRVGPGGSGRLVRGLGGVKWRGGTVAGMLDAQHGERRCLSSSLSARDSAKRSSKLTSTRLDILV